MHVKKTKFYYHLARAKRKILRAGYLILRFLFPTKFLWKIFAQSGELDFHKENKWRQTDEFMEHTDKLMKRMGYNENSFQGKVLVDMGNGSKLRSKYFKDSLIIAIDPLNDEFIKNIEWSDVREAYKCFSVPAEEMVDEIVGTADFVMCINVLDHTYSPKRILENIYAYLKDDGEFFLSVDLNQKIPNSKHPHAFSDESVKELLDNAGFVLQKHSNGVADQSECNYGSGDGGAANYVLRKK